MFVLPDKICVRSRTCVGGCARLSPKRMSNFSRLVGASKGRKLTSVVEVFHDPAEAAALEEFCKRFDARVFIVRTNAAAEFIYRVFTRHNTHFGPIWTDTGQGIECVNNAEEPGGKRDVRSAQAIWVSQAVHALVVESNQVQNERIGLAHAHQPFMSKRGVLLHDRELVARQLSRLLQDLIWNIDLADVVQRRPDTQPQDLGVTQAVRLRKHACVEHHPPGMCGCRLILEFDRLDEGHDDVG